jgi:AcrR family transcriptional regulator
MREEGPAVTTRRLASEVGVSNQLVHYYFRTMMTCFFPSSGGVLTSILRRLLDALSSDEPLKALGKLNSDPDTTPTECRPRQAPAQHLTRRGLGHGRFSGGLQIGRYRLIIPRE